MTAGTETFSAARAEPLLSERLIGLHRTFADRPAQLRAIILVLEARAYALLMILCALPFLPPVSIPGSSTPLGLIVAVIAVQLAFGRLPWLPRRLLDWTLPAGFFAKLVQFTLRIVRFLERFMHPRWSALTLHAGLRACHLFAIVVAGLLLALPIVFPFTNTLPGWTIVLLACGLLERDGLFIVLGHVLLVISVAYFFALGSGIVELFQRSWQWLVG